MAKRVRKEDKKKLPAGFSLRADGTYMNRFTVEGKRYCVYGKTQDECRMKELVKRSEINQHLVGKESITLHTYFEKWCSRRERNKEVKPATIYTDRRRFKKIDAVIGSKKLKKIEKSDIYDLIDALQRDDVSSKGIKDTLSLLKTIMKSAVDNDYILKNPCDGVKPPKRTEEEKETLNQKHRYLSAEEISIFFKYAKDSIYCNMFSFMLLSGVRCGEACALTWSDIDEDQGVIHITKTVTRVNDKKFEIGTPKTEDSRRDIQLTNEIRTILKQQKLNQVALFGFAAGASDQLIFTTQKHDIIKQSNVSPVIANICKRATDAGEPIEKFTSHSFRHTYVSLELAKGIPLNVIAKQIGHTNTITLQKYYSHEDPQMVHEAFHETSAEMGRMMQIQQII